MEIKTNEHYGGIHFQDSEHAYKALVLYLAGVYKSIKYTGQSLFEANPPFLLNEFMRISSFINQLKEHGQASVQYGDNPLSIIQNMRLAIINSKKGSILYMSPYSINRIDYEGTLIELLNNKALRMKLQSYFGDKEYQRILKEATLSFSGSEEEITDLCELLTKNTGLRIHKSKYNDTEEQQIFGEREYQLSKSTGETYPSNIEQYTVRIEGGVSSSRLGLYLAFLHPGDYPSNHEFYGGPHLIYARDSFKKELENILNASRNLEKI